MIANDRRTFKNIDSKLTSVSILKELTFLDLVVLEKIEKDTHLDGFGGHINSSFFDTASLMGTLQVKGLVEIKSVIGRSTANRTPLGDEMLHKAAEKSQEPLDELDHAILKTVAAGPNTFDRIKDELNLRSDDLAFHIYKIVQQGYADYEIKNTKLSLILTENGFKLAGFVPKRERPAQAAAASAASARKQNPPSNELEAAMLASDDMTAGIQQKSKVELTQIRRAQAKTAHYIRAYAPILLIVLAVSAIILVVKYMGLL